MAEVKSAVQSAVMWQVIYDPFEQGPLAPVIRGNPWGLDKGVVNDDWPYVIFDWSVPFSSVFESSSTDSVFESSNIYSVGCWKGQSLWSLYVESRCQGARILCIDPGKYTHTTGQTH